VKILSFWCICDCSYFCSVTMIMYSVREVVLYCYNDGLLWRGGTAILLQ
jgi:hypothetical protein